MFYSPMYCIRRPRSGVVRHGVHEYRVRRVGVSRWALQRGHTGVMVGGRSAVFLAGTEFGPGVGELVAINANRRSAEMTSVRVAAAIDVGTRGVYRCRVSSPPSVPVGVRRGRRRRRRGQPMMPRPHSVRHGRVQRGASPIRFGESQV